MDSLPLWSMQHAINTYYEQPTGAEIMNDVQVSPKFMKVK